MGLQQADDNLATYQQFILWPQIDEYISKFKGIAHKAGYNPADQNTMQQFLQGLPQSIGQKVLKDTAVETYKQMKQKAISVTAF